MEGITGECLLRCGLAVFQQISQLRVLVFADAGLEGDGSRDARERRRARMGTATAGTVTAAMTRATTTREAAREATGR